MNPFFLLFNTQNFFLNNIDNPDLRNFNGNDNNGLIDDGIIQDIDI